MISAAAAAAPAAGCGAAELRLPESPENKDLTLLVNEALDDAGAGVVDAVAAGAAGGGELSPVKLPNEEHPVYPYLLRGLRVDRPNQVWAADITYIPLARGFAYLVAIMDWHSRRVLSWRLSNTLDSSFCVEALQEALSRFGRPEIFNSDQGSQFTAKDFIDVLLGTGVKISMDGKGRCIDNVFVERLWRSLKYEDVYLKAYTNLVEARAGIETYFRFYNTRRSHQALGYQTPAAFYDGLQRRAA